MQIRSTKEKILIIGADFLIFHYYFLFLSEDEDKEYLGFINIDEKNKLTSSVKFLHIPSLPIYPNNQLEEIIQKERINKCLIKVNEINGNKLNSLLHRIISTGSCSIEFFSPENFNISVHKPVIIISFLSKIFSNIKLTKSLSQLFSSAKKICSVIIPYFEINFEKEIILENEIHYRFDSKKDIKKFNLSNEFKNKIKDLLLNGVSTVFVTTDIRRATITCEQISDIIIYDSNILHNYFIKSHTTFCITDEELLNNIKINLYFPGLINFFRSDNILVITENLNNFNYPKIKNHFKTFPKFFPITYNTSNENIPLPLPKSLSGDLNFFSNLNFFNNKYPPIDILFDNSFIQLIFDSFILIKKPSLQKHFEYQADLIKNLSSASSNELYVTNNDSSNKESICRLFLESHIQPGYSVTTGEIIDSLNNTTGQLDVIIVNDEAPSLTMDTSHNIIAPILADSVLCVMEIKTTLTSETLKKALSQLRPVKSLMPSSNKIELSDGSIIPDPLNGKILTGVFAFGLNNNDLESKIPEIVEIYPNIADFIILPEHWGFFSKETLTLCGIDIPNKDNNTYSFR